MTRLTKKQEAVRKFIDDELKAGRACPTHREIAAHFGFSSPNAAARHLKALVKKGVLLAEQGKVRALQVAERFPAAFAGRNRRNSLVRFHPCGFWR